MLFKPHPKIATIKLLTGEEIVCILAGKSARKLTVAVPMKLVFDSSGAVHLVPWVTAAVDVDGMGGFKWSDQPFEINADHVTMECCPMAVVEKEYLKRLKDPAAWLNGVDIDSFSVPEGLKIQ